MHLLPMLAPERLKAFLADDPAAGIVGGIVRRAWTLSGVRLRLAQDLAEDLRRAGIGPVMLAGPVAAFARRGRPGVVRPVTEIHLALPREACFKAAERMGREGWTLSEPLPRAPECDWKNHLKLQREDLVLRLIWRHLPAPPWKAKRCEAELFARAEPVMPLDDLLLSVLANVRYEDALVPWQAECALLIQGPVNWSVIAANAAAYAPTAFDRFDELRALGATVPDLSPRGVHRARAEALLTRTLRAAILAVRRRIYGR